MRKTLWCMSYVILEATLDGGNKYGNGGALNNRYVNDAVLRGASKAC